MHLPRHCTGDVIDRRHPWTRPPHWPSPPTRTQGVLITLKSDGRPQASNIAYATDVDDERVRISVTTSRAKTNNLQRDPRASLHVTSDDFWKWVVLEGDASFSPVATAGDEASVAALCATTTATCRASTTTGTTTTGP